METPESHQNGADCIDHAGVKGELDWTVQAALEQSFGTAYKQGLLFTDVPNMWLLGFRAPFPERNIYCLTTF